MSYILFGAYLLQWVAIVIIASLLIRKGRELWDVPGRLRKLEGRLDSLEEIVLKMHNRLKTSGNSNTQDIEQ